MSLLIPGPPTPPSAPAGDAVDGLLEPVTPLHVLPVETRSAHRHLAPPPGAMELAEPFVQGARPDLLDALLAQVADDPPVEPVLDAEAHVAVVVDGDPLPELRTGPARQRMVEVRLGGVHQPEVGVEPAHQHLVDVLSPVRTERLDLVGGLLLMDDAGHHP